uniref:Glyco_transf_41 domain-containing protein n=1 Tax=Haemonchus contortus TaxID=6289 RepID=A0A7I4YZU3_HAECO
STQCFPGILSYFCSSSSRLLWLVIRVRASTVISIRSAKTEAVVKKNVKITTIITTTTMIMIISISTMTIAMNMGMGIHISMAKVADPRIRKIRFVYSAEQEHHPQGLQRMINYAI